MLYCAHRQKCLGQIPGFRCVGDRVTFKCLTEILLNHCEQRLLDPHVPMLMKVAYYQLDTVIAFNLFPKSKGMVILLILINPNFC